MTLSIHPFASDWWDKRAKPLMEELEALVSESLQEEQEERRALRIGFAAFACIIAFVSVVIYRIFFLRGYQHWFAA